METHLIKSYKHRVFVVDQPIVCLGLKTMFATFGDVELCGYAMSVPAALDKIGKMQPLPDLVIMELSVRGGSATNLLQQLVALYPQLRILIFSSKEERIFAMPSLRMGANAGYVSKHSGFEELTRAFRKALRGEVALSEGIRDQLALAAVGKRHQGSPIERLSNRELEILCLLGQGHGTRKVAEMLHLSIKTIESHRGHIKEKLLLKNANELLQQAMVFANMIEQ